MSTVFIMMEYLNFGRNLGLMTNGFDFFNETEVIVELMPSRIFHLRLFSRFVHRFLFGFNCLIFC
jgi:hypothetical protein